MHNIYVVITVLVHEMLYILYVHMYIFRVTCALHLTNMQSVFDTHTEMYVQCDYLYNVKPLVCVAVSLTDVLVVQAK